MCHIHNYLESSNIVAHIGLGDLQSPESRQDTRNNSLTASNDGGLSDGLYGGYIGRGRPNPHRQALTTTGSLQTDNTR